MIHIEFKKCKHDFLCIICGNTEVWHLYFVHHIVFTVPVCHRGKKKRRELKLHQSKLSASQVAATVKTPGCIRPANPAEKLMSSHLRSSYQPDTSQLTPLAPTLCTHIQAYSVTSITFSGQNHLWTNSQRITFLN